MQVVDEFMSDSVEVAAEVTLDFTETLPDTLTVALTGKARNALPGARRRLIDGLVKVSGTAAAMTRGTRSVSPSSIGFLHTNECRLRSPSFVPGERREYTVTAVSKALPRFDELARREGTAAQGTLAGPEHAFPEPRTGDNQMRTYRRTRPAASADHPWPEFSSRRPTLPAQVRWSRRASTDAMASQHP